MKRIWNFFKPLILFWTFPSALKQQYKYLYGPGGKLSHDTLLMKFYGYQNSKEERRRKKHGKHKR